MIIDHGRFDILAELGPSLLLDILRIRIDLRAASTNISTPEISSAIDSSFSIEEVSFNLFAPQVFITLKNVLRLRPTAAPVTDYFILVADITPDGLNVVLNSDMTPIRFFDPGIDIGSIPDVELIIAEIIAREGDAAGRSARDRIQREFNAARDEAARSLAPIENLFLFDFPAMLNETAPPTTSLALGTRNGSLRLGGHLGGRGGGSHERILNDNLLETAREVGLFIIPNATLLGDFLRPSVDARFSLSGNGSFVPDHPLSWSGSSTLFPTDVGNLNLTAVRASTSSPNRIVLDLSAGARLAGGAINIHVRMRAIMTLTATRDGSNLNLIPTLLPVEVIEARVDVEAWVYAAIAFGGGPYFLGVLAVADSIVDGELHRLLTGIINSSMLPTIVLNFGIPIIPTPNRVVMLLAEPRILPSLVEPITGDLLVTLT
jgi:hypothetical protein